MDVINYKECHGAPGMPNAVRSFSVPGTKSQLVCQELWGSSTLCADVVHSWE